MNTCKSCKWWGWWPGFEHRNELGMYRPCNAPKGAFGAPESADGWDVLQSIDSTFATGPDFGCVHFQSKEPQVVLDTDFTGK